jgi:hypothetical protein
MMATMTIRDWRERDQEIWHEPEEDTEMLALSGVAAAAMITMGGLALAVLTLLIPALLVGG